MLNRKGEKSDPEWEIASAEKVEIVRGASARTVSRSDSSRGPSRDGDGNGNAGPRNNSTSSASGPRNNSTGAGGRQMVGSGVLKVGMKVGVPERKNVALTSNPPIPSPSQFPTPPSSSSGSLGSEKKTNSWPLPD